jgi:hypothetical protein
MRSVTITLPVRHAAMGQHRLGVAEMTAPGLVVSVGSLRSEASKSANEREAPAASV